MAEVPHDPTVTLRIELGRVTDQRDAFKAALNAEILKLVRVSIIQATIDADDEIARLRERIDNLVIKNNERHAEFALLGNENAFLKAEVERLKNNCAYIDRELDLEIDKTAMLCGQVERLTKAGDAMASSIQFNEEMEQDYNGPPIVRQCVKDWNAAKEGKQP